MVTTVSLSATSARTRAEPMNPAPPVTKTVIRLLEQVRLIVQPGMFAIAFGNHQRFGREGPVDRQGRIVPQQAAVMRRTVEIGYLVEHFRIVFERAIAMREAGRDPQLPPIACAQ